jgi:hypothetical protein
MGLSFPGAACCVKPCCLSCADYPYDSVQDAKNLFFRSQMACHNNEAEHVAGIGHSVANSSQNFPANQNGPKLQPLSKKFSPFVKIASLILFHQNMTL